ncbi:MAG TPA: WYL domain-containing protein [Microbacteriaceae bacterium]|nr:WYL domain-containing protein [Microbacteriaceae bacterium]
MTGSQVKKIAPEERIFSLVLALVASPRGLTKDQLLSSVYGYSIDYVHGKANSSLERKFERDKEQLRFLGVPIDVIETPEESGNNQLLRYRISKNNLQLPENIRFSIEELALLRSAALAWSETSLSAHSRQALMKLESMSSNIDPRHIGVAPKVFIQHPATEALYRAIHGNNSVKFKYKKPQTKESEDRRVTPYRLHRADTRWHLVAFDHDRDDWRTFLLSRITSPVKLIAAIDRVDRSEEVIEVIKSLERLQHKQIATVFVKKGSTAHSRLEPRARSADKTNKDTEANVETQPLYETQTLYIETLDFDELADELVAYAGDILQLEPQKLFKIFKEKLLLILQMHSTENTQK